MNRPIDKELDAPRACFIAAGLDVLGGSGGRFWRFARCPWAFTGSIRSLEIPGGRPVTYLRAGCAPSKAAA